ncbi:RsbRD N-terminal domain-containing protein [Microcoleus sp. herbarium2]|uniref:RsbRD N-terminal domain-containing protein n=1 Tax=Microcoleus sp. herbarium2 TaxID=3055433 RepID=UPI004040882C
MLHIAVGHGNFSDIKTPEWENIRVLVASVSRLRVQRGFTPSEIASFILCFLCFKKPLFDRLCHELTQNRAALVKQLWLSTSLLDQLGVWVTEIFLKAGIAKPDF